MTERNGDFGAGRDGSLREERKRSVSPTLHFPFRRTLKKEAIRKRWGSQNYFSSLNGNELTMWRTTLVLEKVPRRKRENGCEFARKKTEKRGPAKVTRVPDKAPLRVRLTIFLVRYNKNCWRRRYRAIGPSVQSAKRADTEDDERCARNAVNAPTERKICLQAGGETRGETGSVNYYHCTAKYLGSLTSSAERWKILWWRSGIRKDYTYRGICSTEFAIKWLRNSKTD